MNWNSRRPLAHRRRLVSHQRRRRRTATPKRVYDFFSGRARASIWKIRRLSSTTRAAAMCVWVSGEYTPCPRLCFFFESGPSGERRPLSPALGDQKERACAAPPHTMVDFVADTTILDQIALVTKTDRTGALGPCQILPLAPCSQSRILGTVSRELWH
jgi:hypothetical protein